jgi:hypothetical protein
LQIHPCDDDVAKETVMSKKLFMCIHQLPNVTAGDVAAAHAKDLATQARFGVDFKAYWVDEKNGRVYCFCEAPSAEAVTSTHTHAHGLVAEQLLEVIADTTNWTPTPGAKLFMDVHALGKGNVTPQALADAHAKDLAVQAKHGVRCLNYWLEEASGTVFCLIEGPTADACVHTHRDAHGLLPDSIDQVIEGR